MDARRIKSRHLAALVEATRTGSLKAAAERLFLTQPAISKTLKDLEEIVGVRLLERGRGGLDLTSQGRVFLPFAEQSLAALQHGLDSLEGLSTGMSDPLRIGALPSVAADLLPRAVEKFLEISPNTPITVEEGRISSMLKDLRAGAMSLVIGRMGTPETMTGLSFTQMYSERILFIVQQGHPLIAKAELEDVAARKILYPPASAAIRPLVDRFMLSRGVARPHNRLETVSVAFGRSMTLGPTQPIWIISEGAVSDDLESGRLVALDIDTRDMSGPIGIMARAEEEPTPNLRLFRQALLMARDDMSRF